MTNSAKTKKIIGVIKNHFKWATQDVKKILKKNESDELRDILYNGPSVNDMFDVATRANKAGISCNEIGDNYMYDFLRCDDNVSYLRRKRMVKKILDEVGLKNIDVFVTDDAFMMDNYGKCEQRFYFLLHRGRNGSGDFVNVDMTEVQEIINIIRDCGASDACVTDVFVDAADDVSEWVISFTLDHD